MLEVELHLAVGLLLGHINIGRIFSNHSYYRTVIHRASHKRTVLRGSHHISTIAYSTGCSPHQIHHLGSIVADAIGQEWVAIKVVTTGSNDTTIGSVTAGSWRCSTTSGSCRSLRKFSCIGSVCEEADIVQLGTCGIRCSGSVGVNRVAIAVKVVRPELLIVGVEIIPLVISTVPSNVLIIHEIWNQVSCTDGHIIKISILCVIGENTKSLGLELCIDVDRSWLSRASGRGIRIVSAESDRHCFLRNKLVNADWLRVVVIGTAGNSCQQNDRC